MIAMSNLAENEDPGYFMLVELGVAIGMSGYIPVKFSLIFSA